MSEQWRQLTVVEVPVHAGEIPGGIASDDGRGFEPSQAVFHLDADGHAQVLLRGPMRGDIVGRRANLWVVWPDALLPAAVALRLAEGADQRATELERTAAHLRKALDWLEHHPE